jgi:hypothetical protein
MLQLFCSYNLWHMNLPCRKFCDYYYYYYYLNSFSPIRYQVAVFW